MFRRIELSPKEGLFLLNNEILLKPQYVTDKDKSNIIGYSITKNIIISINSSKNGLIWSCIIDERIINNVSNSDGKYNTRKIVNYCNKNSLDPLTYFPAAHYCITYSPGFKNGEWYLPSIDELKLLYSKISNFRVYCEIAGIDTNMRYNSTGSYYFWSSTEYSDFRALGFYFNSSIPMYYNKHYDRYVVPFLRLN